MKSALSFLKPIGRVMSVSRCRMPQVVVNQSYSCSYSLYLHTSGSRHTVNYLLGSDLLLPQSAIQKRFRKKVKGSTSGTKQPSDEDNEDESDDDDLAEENPLLVDDIVGEAGDIHEKTVIDVVSLRLDAVAKAGFNTTRAKVEEAFYKGNLYVNGQRPFKKSMDISVGDEIDMVKRVNKEDHTLIDIARIQITHMPDKATQTGRFKLQIDKWQNLTVKAHEISE